MESYDLAPSFVPLVAPFCITLNRQICDIQVRYVYSDLLSSIGNTQQAS